MKKKEHIPTKIYMAVGCDEYEFPIELFENLSQCCSYSKTKKVTMNKRISRGSVDKKRNCKYVRVDLREGAYDNN